MVNKKEISNVLSLYEVENYSVQSKENLKSRVENINIRCVPGFCLTGFLSGVIKSLTPWFYVISFFYLAAVFVISRVPQSGLSPVLICLVTPFTALGTVGCVYYHCAPQNIETESACLYKPETVFAGKLVLCAIYDLAAVCAAGLMSGDFLYTVMLSFSAFLLSSALSLGLCVFCGARAVVGVSFGVCGVLAGLFFLRTDLALAVQEFLFGIPVIYLAAVLVLLIFSAVTVSLISVKNFNFERADKI
ncbi:MAG: hypothetical protein MJ177_00910 [Clostridia bacterium]|nr:hypothetical protein [Clostridia bacterium]